MREPEVEKGRRGKTERQSAGRHRWTTLERVCTALNQGREAEWGAARLTAKRGAARRAEGC